VQLCKTWRNRARSIKDKLSGGGPHQLVTRD
jgi:hypothetical protein